MPTTDLIGLNMAEELNYHNFSGGESFCFIALFFVSKNNDFSLHSGDTQISLVP